MLEKKSLNEIDEVGWRQGEEKNSLAQPRLSPHSSCWEQHRRRDASTGTESGGAGRKTRGMFCSNIMHFTSSLVSTQLVRGSPSTAHQSYFFHLFQLWTGCAENCNFFCPTTCTDQVLLKTPVEHLARTQHWLTKEKLRLIKSSLTGACSRWLCEGGNCFFKQWAACHPRNLH